MPDRVHVLFLEMVGNVSSSGQIRSHHRTILIRTNVQTQFCFAVQINDPGREFVNAISEELHKLTGVEQRITSAYHHQANGLVECQNRTIKNSLVKVLEDNPSKWLYIIEGILFAHIASCHASTKYSPFKLMYNRDPVLPIDVKHNLLPCGEGQDPFDKETFDAALSTALKIREAVTDEVAENIKKTQKKQKRDFDRRHLSGPGIRVGDAVLLRNNTRNERKGGNLHLSGLAPIL